MAVVKQFPESLKESTGSGPDFPGSSGDRERGKFRPSAIPRLDTVAVVGDSGQAVVSTTDALLAEVLRYQKATLLALALLADGTSFSVEDVLGEIG